MSHGYSPHARQAGFTLLEGLIAIVIFSVGILALMAMQGNAIRLNTDAKYRSDATFLVNELLGRLSVADSAAIASFAHRPSGSTCSPSGADSSNAAVTEWLDEVDALLPNAPSSKQQIITNAANNQVTVILCWQAPNSAEHHHTVTTQMQWQ